MLKIIKDNMLKLKLKNKHYKLMAVFFFVFVVGGLFLGVQSVNASFAGWATGITPDAILNLLSRILLTVAEIFMRIGLWALEDLKAIASYNGFMDAPPVVLGWLMVRDLANMFFVVVLLIIAFGTILGLEQYEWKRSLIKLVLAAIFINFSKLILQLIIDASDVFTRTFFNAFSASAGENFINMFKLTEIQKMIAPDYVTATATSESIAFQVFAASVMMVVMAGIAMVTIFAYLVILVARVVMLWILMVLSPLAFVLQTIPAGKKYADDFWQKFVHHVLVAPVMFFFLWLSFATLGSGNIAAQVGINTSQVSQVGQEFGATAGLTTSPSITSSQATTWENLSSFAMTIGFLLAGLTFVQSLGVVGGGLTQKATQFGMAVATIASGYAAGRWVAGRAYEGGKDIAKDYGKLAWGKYGGERIQKIGEGLQKTGVLGGIAGRMITGEGKVKRKAAVERLEKLEQARLAKYKAEGPQGLAAKLAPKKEKIAALEVETEEMQKAKEAEYATMKARTGQELFKGDIGKFYENKANQIQATLGVDVKTMSDKEGNKLYAKVEEAVKKGDYNEAEKAMGAIEKKLEAEAKEKGKTYDRRDIDRKAAAGTYLVRRDLEEKYAEEEAGSQEARRNIIKGSFSHSYLKEESEKLVKEKEAIDSRLIAEKKMDPSIVSSLEKEIGVEKWKGMKDEEKQKMIDLKASAAVTGEVRAKAYEKEGIYKKYAIIGGEYESIQSQRRVNKAKSVLEGEIASAKDISRAQEGKTTDNRRRWEIGKAREALDETGKGSIEDLFADIAQKHGTIKSINEKGKSANEDERKIRESMIQSQTVLVASLVEQYPGIADGFLASLDESYKDVKVNTRENIGRLMAGAITARKWTDVKDDDGFVEVQKQLKSNLKPEKEDYLMRTLSVATKKAADKGFTQFYQQVGEGVDKNGNKKFSFAPIMKAGLGSGDVIGTGKIKDDFGVKYDGKRMQQSAEKGYYLDSYSRHKADDARAWTVRDGNKKALDFQGEEQLKAAISLASASKTEIENNRSLNDFNGLSGGDWSKSSWNSDNGEFDYSTNAMREFMALHLSKLVTRYNEAKTPQLRGDALDVGRVTLSKYGVDNIEGKSVDELSMEDIADFINKKITGIKNDTQRGVQIKDKVQLDDKRSTYKLAQDIKMVKVEEKKPKGGGSGGGNGAPPGSSTPPTSPPSGPAPVTPPTTPPAGPGGSTSSTPSSSRSGSSVSGNINSRPNQPEEVADENVSFGKNAPPPPPNYAKLNESMSKLHDVLNNLSAEMANLYANKAQMSSGEEDRIKGIAKEANIPSDSNVTADYTLGKTIADAINSKNDKERVEANKTVDALTKNGKNKEILESLTGEGKLNEADVIKLGRAITIALKSIEEGSSDEKDKPKT